MTVACIFSQAEEEEQILHKICQAVQDFKCKRSSNPLMQFRGLGNFEEKVVFASVSQGSNELRLLRDCINKWVGHAVTDDRFTPDVSLMRVQRNSEFKLPTKEIVDKFHNFDFGLSALLRLELVSMKKGEDGLRNVLRKFKLDPMTGH